MCNLSRNLLRSFRSSALRILALDGGGVRGLVSTVVLSVVEEILGRPTRDLFDLVGGTSAGGILALAFATGKDALQCQRLIFRMKDEVRLSKIFQHHLFH